MSQSFTRRNKKSPNEGPIVTSTQKRTHKVDITVKQQEMEVITSLKRSNKNPIVRKTSLNRSIEASNTSSKKYPFTETKQAPQVIPEDMEHLMKQNQELKIMALSEQVRDALKKVQRFDRYIYAKQSQKKIYEPLKLELKRLERIKNLNRQMRSQMYDNQLTVTALYNHVKLIHEMNAENIELKQFKEIKQKQQAKKKQQQFKKSLQARKNRSTSKPTNQKLQQQKKKLAELIQVNIKQKNYQKIQKQIPIFIKKFGNDQSHQQVIHLYESIYELSSSSIEMQDILKQTTQILQTLSIANLNQIDSCLRSLKSNHTQFKQFNTKYKNHDKFHGKQMINILHNLQRFNDDIIKYLEEKKNIQKAKKDTLEISRSITVEKNAQISQVSKKVSQYKKKLANLEVEHERAKHKIKDLEQMKARFEEEQKTFKSFELKFNRILDKIKRKTQWHHEFEVLKKDKQFIAKMPYNLFFAMEEGIKYYNQSLKTKQNLKIQQLLQQIHGLFKQTSVPHEKKLQQVSKIMDNAGKKNFHSLQVIKKVQIILVAVMEYMKDEFQKIMKKKLNQSRRTLQESVSRQKQKSKRLSLEISQIKEDEVRRSRSIIKQNKQLKKLMNLIDQFIANKDFAKIQKNIHQFLRKFGDQKQMQEKIHVYKVLQQLLSNSNQMESILKEIAVILQTLSIADLNEVDACLRSLKSNHTQFKQFNTKYRNHDKFHGKQMINILHNLERFNDDIIKYLQQKKKTEKAKQNTLQISRSITVQKNTEIMEAKKVADEYKKKLANLQVEFERTKHKVKDLEQINVGYEKEEKTLKNFETKFNKVLDKMRRKIDWHHDFDMLKKDKQFVAKMPYNMLFSLEDGIQLFNEGQKSKQINKIQNLFQRIEREFKNKNLSLQKKYSNISVLIQNAGKKSFFPVQLFKRTYMLIINVSEQVKTEKNAHIINELQVSRSKMQKQLSQTKKKLSNSADKFSRTPPRAPLKSRQQTPEKQQKKIQQLQNKIHTYEEKIKKYENQLKQGNDMAAKYDTFSNKFSTIVQKMTRNANWHKQLQSLQAQDRFAQLKFIGNLSVMIENLRVSQQNEIKKQMNKVNISLNNFNKVLQRGNPSTDKLKTQLQRNLNNQGILGQINQNMKSIMIKLIEKVPQVPPQTPKKRDISQEKEVQKKYKLLQTTNKKLMQSIQTQINKSRDLNDKLKSVQKSQRQRIQSVQRQKGQQKQKIQQQLAKNKAQKCNLQASLTKLQKQNKLVNDQIVSIQQFQNNFQQDIKVYAETVYNLINQKMFRKIDIQLTKINKKYQKNDFALVLIQICHNLLSSVSRNAEQKDKLEKDSRFDDVIRIIQKSVTQLKKPSKQKKDWRKIFERDIQNKEHLLQLVNLMNIYSEKLAERGNNIDQVNQKIKINTSLIKSLMQALRAIQKELNRKDFLLKQFNWENISVLNVDDPIFEQLIKILNMSTKMSRQKINQQKNRYDKLNSRMDEELLKLNNMISQLQKDLALKQKSYQQMQIQFNELQKRSQDIPPIDRSSIKSSRKSFRSRTPQKQRNELQTLRAKIQQYAQEQRVLFEKVSTLEKDIQNAERQKKQHLFKIQSLESYRIKCRDLQASLRQQSQQYKILARSQQEKFVKQLKKINESREQVIRDHNYELQRIKTSLQSQIELLKNKLIQHQQNSYSVQQYENLRIKYHEKEQQLIKLQKQKQKIITEEVLKALKSQQDDFNKFLANRQKELESELKQQYEKLIQSSGNQSERYLKEAINKSQKNKDKQISDLKLYYEKKNRELSQSQAQANDQLQKIKFQYQSLNSQITLKNNQNESCRSMMKQLQNSKFKEITQMRNFYDTKVRQLTQSQSTLNSQINTLKLDNQSLTYKLNSKIQQIQQIQREYKNRNSDLNEQLTRKLNQSIAEYQIKVNKVNSVYELTSNELIQVKNKYQDVNKRLNEQERLHRQQVQKLMSELTQQKRYWENKNRQLNDSFQSRLRNIQIKLDESQTYKEKYINLQRQYSSTTTTKVVHSVNQQNLHVPPQIQDLSSRLQNYQQHLQSLSHNQYQNQYRRLQQQYHGLMKENLNRIESLKNEHSSAIDKMRQINTDLRMQIKQKQYILTNERQKLQKIKNQNNDKTEEIMKLKKQKDSIYLQKEQFERQLLYAKEQIQKLKYKVQQIQNQNERISRNRTPQQSESFHFVSSNRTIELDAIITNKNLEIRQLEEMIDRKKRQIDDQRQKNHNLQRQCSHYKQQIFKSENKLSSLESINFHLQTQMKSLEIKNQSLTKQINEAQGQVHLYQSKVTELQNKQSILRNDFIRVKTESQYEHHHTHDRQTKMLRQQIIVLKDQIRKINDGKFHTNYDHSILEKDKLKIQEMIQTRQVNKNRNHQKYDEVQIQVLKRINMEVSELVKANRSLHTKCILLESQIVLTTEQVQIMTFYTNIQALLDSIMNFLIDNSLIHTSQAYQKFLGISQRALGNGEFNIYFQHLQHFLKAQFMTINDIKQEAIQRKTDQLQRIKEQMQEMMDKQLQFNEDQSYGALEKYKMIFTDVKYLLKEYIRLRDQQYLNMICRSLGIQSK